MNKKNFKDNTANIDRFFSGAGTQETDDTQNTQSTSETLSTHDISDTPQKSYRINLKLRPEYRQYLDDEAWKARKSITEYLNDLIQADMDEKNMKNT